MQSSFHLCHLNRFIDEMESFKTHQTYPVSIHADEEKVFSRPAGITFSHYPTPSIIVADKDNHRIQGCYLNFGYPLD